MNKKAKKAYEKAMNNYENGKINKALELCEEALSEGLDNPLVLNFKGLLLYQKGNLDEAVTVWRINKDLNNDNISENYIKDVIADENKLELYKQAEQELKQFKIDKALELFKLCSESDFNAIRVNTGIAMCYHRKGEFRKAKEYLDKALSIDKNAVTAKIIEKELKETGTYIESKKSTKKIAVGLTSLFLFFAIGAAGYSAISKFKSKDLSDSVLEEKNSVTLDENNIQSEKEDNKITQNTEVKSNDNSGQTTKEISVKANFDGGKLKLLMDNGDLDGVYEQLKNVNKESMSAENVEIYNKAINLMKNEGVAKFYEYGLWYFNEGNYSEAKSSFDKAYTYCEGNSLKEHILFYRASNSSKESENKIAFEQFEEYYKQYPKGVYIQEALYKLALIGNSVDKEKSKVYADILIRDFPNSIYTNDNIRNIVTS